MDGRIQKDGEAVMLIICDESPVKSAAYLIKHTNKNFCFKSLLELSQLICSCEISSVYKPIKQGKELQEWIKKYHFWIITFYAQLFRYVRKNLNLKESTIIKFLKIQGDLSDYYFKNKCKNRKPKTAIFRYVKEYEEFTEYPTNTELPIEIAIKEYEKYVEFKKDKWKGE